MFDLNSSLFIKFCIFMGYFSLIFFVIFLLLFIKFMVFFLLIFDIVLKCSFIISIFFIFVDVFSLNQVSRNLVFECEKFQNKFKVNFHYCMLILYLFVIFIWCNLRLLNYAFA